MKESKLNNNKEQEIESEVKCQKEINGKIVVSMVYNPDNSNECILIFPKDEIAGYGYKDYYQLGFRPTNLY